MTTSCKSLRQPRRHFLSDMGMGFTGLALGSLLARDGVARTAESTASVRVNAAITQFAPKAKSVIWYFMPGGTSHLESFDSKPAVDKFAGLTIDESPFKSSVLDSSFYRKNVRDFAGTPRALMAKLYPTQVGFRRRGNSGIEVSDWWPHVGDCVDDLAIVRSMWTTDNDHAAQLQFHTGQHTFDGFHPSIGSWVHYGLGSLNDNLPQFVVMGGSPGDCCGGVGAHSASYLGPEHSGINMALDPNNPLPFGIPGASVSIAERREQLDLLKDLKQRGLLEETLVVWATEFGRTPGAEHSDGRDHHPYGFSVDGGWRIETWCSVWGDR